MTDGLMRRREQRRARQGQFGHFVGVDSSEEWYTPRVIFDALGEQFDLDPCSPVDGPLPWIPAAEQMTKLQDGLLQEWFGFVWMNPPYGTATPVWMRRMIDHGHGIALVYARTDTYWFHEAALAASAVCFVKGRIRFVDRNETEQASGRPGAGSVLFGFGPRGATAVNRCNLGWMARTRHEP